MAVTIAKESPVGADLTLLFTRHTADMHADTPPESIHMMDASELAIPAVQFFVAREAGQPLAMGAFKMLSDPTHAEIKSMHVLAEARGRGLSKAMLAHVEATARAAGEMAAADRRTPYRDTPTTGDAPADAAPLPPLTLSPPFAAGPKESIVTRIRPLGSGSPHPAPSPSETVPTM